MNIIHLFVAITIFGLVSQVESQLSCYSCFYTGSEAQSSCIDSPWNYTLGSNLVECTNTTEYYCETSVIQQKDPADGTLSIYTVARGCAMLDDGHVVGEENCECAGTGCEQRTCTSYCQQDKCNNQDLTFRDNETLPVTTTTATTTTDDGIRRCYSCTYNLNDAKLGYECVTDPENFDLTANVVQCNDTNTAGQTLYCATDMTQFLNGDTGEYYINTMSRGCLPMTDGREEGCSAFATGKSCFTYCSGSLCNEEDLSCYEDQVEGDGVCPGGGGGDGASSTYGNIQFICITILMSILLHY